MEKGRKGRRKGRMEDGMEDGKEGSDYKWHFFILTII